MLLRKAIFSCLVFILCTNTVVAKEQSFTLKLKKIVAVKTTEGSGDELYFSISEYPSNATPRINRVPIFPLHWLSSDLAKVHDVILWQGKIADNQSMLLIISLLEQDVEPWNIDDHIGSVQVKVTNNKNKLNFEWGQPLFSDQPRVMQMNSKVPDFVMLGDGGKYELSFKVE